MDKKIIKIACGAPCSLKTVQANYNLAGKNKYRMLNCKECLRRYAGANEKQIMIAVAKNKHLAVKWTKYVL